jgi:hypothetical protein
MTWAQRAEAGVDAKHFQAALAAKGGGLKVSTDSEALGRETAEGLRTGVGVPVRSCPVSAFYQLILVLQLRTRRPGAACNDN